MNVYDEYPTSVTLDGKLYRLDLAYDNVLRCIDLADDNTLTDADRLEAQVLLLLRRRRDLPKDTETRARLLSAVLELLPKGDNTGGERYMDIHQDAPLIRSAFFRIGVDLQRDRPHICRFLELLGDLPSDTALMRTVEIRQRPVPKPTKYNAEEIAAIQKAKARVAIKMSEDERRARFAESLKNSSILKG